MIGEGYLGKSVMEMCEEERRIGGVGRDPVGSTDPEVSRISHPCTMWRAKRPLLPILALNARLLPISGV